MERLQSECSLCLFVLYVVMQYFCVIRLLMLFMVIGITTYKHNHSMDATSKKVTDDDDDDEEDDDEQMWHVE